jgi:hypothetical protein
MNISSSCNHAEINIFYKSRIFMSFEMMAEYIRILISYIACNSP